MNARTQLFEFVSNLIILQVNILSLKYRVPNN